MKRALVIVLTFVLSIVSLNAQLPGFFSTSTKDIDKTKYPIITTKVIFYDSNGNPYKPDLEDVEIYQGRNNLNRCRIDSIVCPENSQIQKPNLSIVLVLDISGSMKSGESSAGEQAIKAAKRFVDLTNINSEIAIVTFESRANRILNFTKTNKSGKRIIKKNLDNIVISDGGTNYSEAFDDISEGAITTAGMGNYQKVIVFLTDGYPDNNYYNPNEAIQRAMKYKISVFPIIVGKEAHPSLIKFAGQTNGDYIENVSIHGNQIEKVFSKISGFINNIEPCTIYFRLKEHLPPKPIKIEFGDGDIFIWDDFEIPPPIVEIKTDYDCNDLNWFDFVPHYEKRIDTLKIIKDSLLKEAEYSYFMDEIDNRNQYTLQIDSLVQIVKIDSNDRTLRIDTVKINSIELDHVRFDTINRYDFNNLYKVNFMSYRIDSNLVAADFLKVKDIRGFYQDVEEKTEIDSLFRRKIYAYGQVTDITDKTVVSDATIEDDFGPNKNIEFIILNKNQLLTTNNIEDGDVLVFSGVIHHSYNHPFKLFPPTKEKITVEFVAEMVCNISKSMDRNIINFKEYRDLFDEFDDMTSQERNDFILTLKKVQSYGIVTGLNRFGDRSIGIYSNLQTNMAGDLGGNLFADTQLKFIPHEVFSRIQQLINDKSIIIYTGRINDFDTEENNKFDDFKIQFDKLIYFDEFIE